MQQFLNAQGNPVDVSPTNPLPLTSKGYSASVSIGRPENTTAYTALDVIGVADSGTAANAGSAIIELANLGPAGGGEITLVDWSLTIGLAAVTSGMTSFRLHLFNASPTAILDNAAFDLASADRTKYLGYLDASTPVDLGSTIFTQGDQLNKRLTLASSSLFAILQTIGGYTPASATTYLVRARSLT